MSLTKKWKAKELKNGWYWIMLEWSAKPFPAYSFDNYFDEQDNEEIVEVVAPCDYDEMQRLKEEHERGCLDCDYLAEYGKMRPLLRECIFSLNYHIGMCPNFQKGKDLLTRINEVLK